jgi:hypothetical protein
LDAGFGPWCAAGEDGVCEDDELSGAGNERDFVGVSGGDETLVEGNELPVPLEGGWQSSGVDAGSQPRTTAPDMALTVAFAAGIVEWGDASEGGGLLARQLSEFRHEHDDGKRGAQGKAVDAQYEIETLGDIAMAAHRGFELCKHPGASQRETLDIVQHEAAMPGHTDMLKTRLDALEVFLDLLNEDENIWGPGLRV